MRYLLDTNILSEPARPRPNPGVMAGIEDHRHDISTATPVWNELLYSCFRLPPSERRRKLEGYLMQILAPALPIFPYDVEAAAWHAAERARLASLGRTPPFVDGQIAAIARVRDLILVTRNASDYRDFEGLEVADWTRS